MMPLSLMPEFPPKSEFRKWLLSLPPDEVVADNWTCHDCPLAMWLHKTGVINEPYICPGASGVGSDEPTGLWGAGAGDFPLPAWANAFGVAADNFGVDRCLRVTASNCLAILRRAPQS